MQEPNIRDYTNPTTGLWRDSDTFKKYENDQKIIRVKRNNHTK